MNLISKIRLLIFYEIFFRACVTDRSQGESSKKWAALELANWILKFYFRLNSLAYCKEIIETVEGRGFPELIAFPKSQFVTYKFMVGKLYMFNGEFEKSELSLTIAFDNCTSVSIKNKRLILLYLISVRMLHGTYPNQQLLTKYDLNQFNQVVEAVKSGNLPSFNIALKKNYEFFVQKGVYLILERLKLLTYRNLFKRIMKIHNSMVAKDLEFKLQLPTCIQLLKSIGISMDIDELECVLTNLIYNGYIKGYIEHKLKVLVVSENQSFPTIKKNSTKPKE